MLASDKIDNGLIKWATLLYLMIFKCIECSIRICILASNPTLRLRIYMPANPISTFRVQKKMKALFASVAKTPYAFNQVA